MRPSDMEELRASLQHRRHLILEASAATRSELAEVRGAERSPELEDGSQAEQDEARLAELAELQRAELAQIDAALQRLTAGRYGTCRGCGEPLGLARLRALPYAQDCSECAAEREQGAAAEHAASAGPRLVRHPRHER